MAMNFCGQCGEAAVPAERFCVNCGNALRRDEAAPETSSGSVQRAGLPVVSEAVDLIAAGKPAEAIPLLLEVLAARPDHAVARAYLGIAYLRCSRVADARDELEAAVELAPRSFICRSRYAEFLARLGFYDQALVQIDTALAQPIPDERSRYAALELRQFCKDKAKDLFYRRTSFPSLRFLRRNSRPEPANAPV